MFFYYNMLNLVKYKVVAHLIENCAHNLLI